jgi:hypothetical protein
MCFIDERFFLQVEGGKLLKLIRKASNIIIFHN